MSPLHPWEEVLPRWKQRSHVAPLDHGLGPHPLPLWLVPALAYLKRPKHGRFLALGALYVVALSVHVMRVGGDFMALHRFLMHCGHNEDSQNSQAPEQSQQMTSPQTLQTAEHWSQTALSQYPQ